MILNAVVYCAMMFQNEPVMAKGVVLTTPRIVCDKHTKFNCLESVAVNFGKIIKVVPINSCLYSKPIGSKIVYELK